MTSPSILLLKWEEVPFELELIGIAGLIFICNKSYLSILITALFTCTKKSHNLASLYPLYILLKQFKLMEEFELLRYILSGVWCINFKF